jgi:hypothetical protein
MGWGRGFRKRPGRGYPDGAGALSNGYGEAPMIAMNTSDRPPKAESASDSSARKLSPAAQRALAEAEARRAEIDAKAARLPKEHGGSKGPEPVRYGDWEKKGIASDF